MSPKVSIIIPTYNRAHYLPIALESALAQTYENKEIIVINDGSTDSTEDVLRPFMNHIRCYKHENRGLAATKNRGIQLAEGDFICNLDDDDWFHPEKVARQVEAFQKYPEMGICGTGVHFVNAEGELIESYMPPRLTRNTQTLQLLRRCLLVQSSVMIRKVVHGHLGGYKRMLSEDYEFWLRASLHYDIGVVKEYLTAYRQHGNQITGPETRPQLMAAVAQLVEDRIKETPMKQIIPQLQSEEEGYALIGILLAEQRLFELSETYLKRILPNPAGNLGMGFLRFRQNRFVQAKDYIQQLRAPGAPFKSKAEKALRLMEKAQAIVRKPVHNMSPEVVELRREFSHLYASIIRQLLCLATQTKNHPGGRS